MTDLNQRIVRLRREAEEKIAEADHIERLQARFPDLRMHVGRWEKRVLAARSGNGQVTHFDWRHNCGCCPDSPLEIWPYLEIPGAGRVYSDPACFTIGAQNAATFDDELHEVWQKQMRAAGIPEALIEAIAARFVPTPANEDDDDGIGHHG